MLGCRTLCRVVFPIFFLVPITLTGQSGFAQCEPSEADGKGSSGSIPSIETATGCAAPVGCFVGEDPTSEQHQECLRNARIFLPQPELTPERLEHGPGKEFQVFAPSEDVVCFFRPHYAFKADKGTSLKFHCWQMTEDRKFYDEDGEELTLGQAFVIVSENRSGRQRARLYSDPEGENRVDADRLKVKYLDADGDAHNPRYNEVFTEVAVARIFDTLGIPADHMSSVQSVTCVGCNDDPFKTDQDTNAASIQDLGRQFDIAAIERKFPADEIEIDGDSSWSWGDANSFNRGSWCPQQKMEYDAYRLALGGLFNYFNGLDFQNRLVCTEWDAEEEVCLQPTIFVHDVGSTMGKKKAAFFRIPVIGQLFGFLLGKTNKRGHYEGWKDNPPFKNLETCELRNKLGGTSQISEASRLFLLERLEKLDRATVRTVFGNARIHLADAKQRARLEAAGVADVDEAALDEWTDVFMSRIDDIRNVKGCTP